MKNLVFLCCIIASYQLTAQNINLIGSTNQMMKNFDLSANLYLDTLSNKENLYGIGAIENLQGEITILDGEPFLALWGEDNKAKIENSFDRKAVFLVSSNVEEWEEIEITEEFNDKRDLIDYVLRTAEQYELDVENGFPFRITSKVDEIRAHISFISQSTIENFTPKAKKADDHPVRIENEEVEIIGFAGINAGGRFAMPEMPNRKASKMHIHFISKDRKKIGHIENLKMTDKAILFLPKN